MPPETAVMDGAEVAPAQTMVTHEPMTANFEAAIPWDADGETPPADTPVETPDEPEAPATPEPERAAPLTATVDLSTLSDDDLDKLARDEPRLQRRIEQLLNNRLGNRIQQERDSAASKAIADFRDTEAKFAQATAKFEEMEDLSETDPERYQTLMRTKSVADWRAGYLTWAEQRQAESTATPSNPVQMREFQTQFSAAFNNTAIGEFKAAAKALIPYYDQLPDASRKAIEAARYDPNGNWFADVLEATTKGMDKYWQSKLKADVEAARTAGKNEAMADRDEDGPVVVGAKGRAQTADEIIRDHADGKPVAEADKRRAYREKGWE